MIVAFTGKAGSGKDYQAELLQNKGYIKLAFADVIRQEAAKLFGMSLNQFLSIYDNFKESKLFHDITGRNILENIGLIHRETDKNYFVNQVLKQINVKNNYVISDLRYINEFYVVHDFCIENVIPFECIFCNYHSDRYQDKNDNESAWLSNWLCDNNYKHLQKISIKDIQKAERYLY